MKIYCPISRLSILQNYDYVNPKWSDRCSFVKSDYWVYVRLSKNTCAIVSMDFNEFDLVAEQNGSVLNIPEKIDGLTVTEIAPYTFSWSPKNGCLNHNIKEIHIPETITFIAQGTFSFLDDYIRDELIITVDENNPAYETYKLGLYSKKDNALIVVFSGRESVDDGYGNFYNIKNFTPKPGTKIIAVAAINSLAEIRNCRLNDGLEVIEKDAFGIALTGNHQMTLQIPNSVEKIKCKKLCRLRYTAPPCTEKQHQCNGVLAPLKTEK